MSVINNVPRELLRDAMRMLEAHSPGSGSVESYASQDIAELLATAQPAADWERAAFERHYRRLDLSVDRVSGAYRDRDTRTLWDAWQAHATLSAPSHGEQVRAWRDVLAERQRQVTVEGWTPEHDDRNGSCEMAAAAATYATCTEPKQLQICGVVAWPWRRGWWKPTTYRRNLIKAGALILAEIERLDRATAPSAGSQEQGE